MNNLNKYLKRSVLSRQETILRHYNESKNRETFLGKELELQKEDYAKESINYEAKKFQRWNKRIETAESAVTINKTIEETRKYLKWMGTKENHLWQIAEVNIHETEYKPGSIEKFFQKKITDYGALARSYERKWLMTMELTEKISKGWYPILNTLTVTETSYEKVFTPGSQEFSNYIKRVDRKTGKNNSTYFGVNEPGGENGRPHVHIVHLFKTLPNGYETDPNRGLKYPIRREIDSMKNLWPHGLSNPKAIRLHGNDSWGKIGWRWPVNTEDYQPIKSGSIGQIANYLTKYLIKNSTYKGELWKMKRRQNMGKKILINIMNNLTTIQKIKLLNLKTSNLFQILEMKVPKNLIVNASAESLMNSMKSEENGLTKIMKTFLLTDPQINLLKKLRDSITTTRKSRKVSIGSDEMQNLTDTDIFEIKRIFGQEEKKLFPNTSLCLQYIKGATNDKG